MSHEVDPLSLFHPVVARWFRRRYAEPTEIQARAWPAIDRGDHVLLTAPTGSGKTLTAFLSGLQRLLSGEWEPGATRMLYISPLKALNNDVQRNLLDPLDELTAAFSSAGIDCPEINVLTRSGDTPQRDRQRMVRKPPEILITTPESLNLLLSSKRARQILADVRSVVLDEIHAVAGTKRGTHLITAVERLTLLAGEFQRIAISATVRPMRAVADFVAGFRVVGQESHTPRQISIIESESAKQLSLGVRFVGSVAGEDEEDIWQSLTTAFRDLIGSHTATLFFVNTRRHAEKISLFINEGLDHELAYAHHGSLAKEIRRLVEEKLKQGDLKAIVATSSLELGIDIGDLDLVVMVGSPNSVASGLQRIGRAGHRVGEVSRGYIYPLHGRDIVDAAVLAKAILDRDIEETRPVAAPLDVLAQVLLSMTSVDIWNIDELFSFVRTCHPYHRLTRRQFDLVLDMLAGRYSDSRIRELKPRVYIDRFENSVKAADGVLNLIYLSGGTIPDRGYYGLKRAGTQGTIGELDEEFVWERSLGDTFTLGAQTWTITAIGTRDVEVQPAANPINIIPFWRAEAINRDFHYCDRILRALEEWEEITAATSTGRTDAVGTESPGPASAMPDLPSQLVRRLQDVYSLDEGAAVALVEFLGRQRAATGTAVPHRHHVLIERYTDPLDRQGTAHLIIHTLWGGRINRPLALLLEAAWEEEYGYAIQSFADNDCVLLLLPNDSDEALVEGLIRDVTLTTESRIHNLLRSKLETSGLFGGRFRENAGRALLLPRASFKQRMPLWLTRLRSKKLLSAVSRYSDFPILAETWRTCLQEEFDLTGLVDLLSEIQHGEIAIGRANTTTPSPFTRGLIWQKTNTYMYQGDEPPAGGSSNMGDEILKEVLHSSHLRPRLAQRLIREFEMKLRRTWPGYAPTFGDDLLQFAADRLVIPQDEWSDLLAAIDRDIPARDIQDRDEAADSTVGGEPMTAEVASPVAGRLVRLTLPGATVPVIVAADDVAAVWRAAGRRAATQGGEARGVADDHPPAVDDLLAVVSAVDLTGDHGGEVSRETAERIYAGLDRIQTEHSDAEVTEADLESLVARYLSFSGPVSEPRLETLFGPACRESTAALSEDGRVIADSLLEGDDAVYLCDTENLESLLRIARRAARPEFQPLPAAELQAFLAEYTGLFDPGDSPDDLDKILEQLFGFPLPVELWESDVFPARLAVYYKAWLDSVLSNSELIWVGAEQGTTTFVLESERQLLVAGGAEESADELTPDADLGGDQLQRHGRQRGPIFPSDRGSYTFWELRDATGLSAQELTEGLWSEAWQGRCTTDSYEVVRRGIAAGFRYDAAPATGSRTGSRRSRRRPTAGSWKSRAATVGRWIPLADQGAELDLIDREEENKDRVRQLLDRYGVLFRELCKHEGPDFSWRRLFRTLRVMELSGEIVAGQFFEGISGLQFARPETVERLRRRASGATPIREAVYWINACDPASPCGRGISPDRLPSRIPSNYLVYRGTQLVVTARRRGRDLDIHTAEDDPRLLEYFRFFKVLATRDVAPLSGVAVETVNGIPTRDSPFADSLVAAGFVRDYKAFHLPPTLR